MLPEPWDQRPTPFEPGGAAPTQPAPPPPSPRGGGRSSRGSGIRLFQFAGITVFLHWSWFLVAIYEIQLRNASYHAIFWNIAEYLSLFVIVLMHEFGHALACKSVGGKSERIMLWPLGGVAFVNPPPRPGALLWSIAAGPLVNVALAPILYEFKLNSGFGGPDLQAYATALWDINCVLLLFNLLPIYPLDGGQILQALLWFAIGQARSLLVAACIGIAGAVGVAGLALFWHSAWLGILAAFGFMQAWIGIKAARAMLARQRTVRRPELACPHCGKSPPVGPYWRCPCGAGFDFFSHGGACPNCRSTYHIVNCLDCGMPSPVAVWPRSPATPAPVASTPFSGGTGLNHGD